MVNQLYTVIIMNDKVRNIFHKYQYLFDAFLIKGDQFTICEWNELGSNVREAVPELYHAVEDKKEWRAIILSDPFDLCSTDEYEDEEKSVNNRVDEDNPFDYYKNAGKNGKEIEESRVDLIKLTHFLGGFPELGIKRFHDRVSINVLGKKISVSQGFLKIFSEIESRYVKFELDKGLIQDYNQDQQENEERKNDLDAILSHVLIDYFNILLEKNNVKSSYFEIREESADGQKTAVEYRSATDTCEKSDWIISPNEIALFEKDRFQYTEEQIEAIEENKKFFEEYLEKPHEIDGEKEHILFDFFFPTAKNEPEEYTEEEKKQYEAIINSHKYDFLPVRPTDIIIIAMSKDMSYNDLGLVNSAWSTDFENSSSTFWERNKYPKTCRFISVPVTNPKNAYYGKMMFEYWMIVLTLATTDIPASSLQGYRLYECGVKIDKQELKDLMNSHVSRLRTMSESIRIKEEKLKKRDPNVFFEDNDNFSLKETIEVVFPGSGPESILRSELHPCIASDIPKKEQTLWFDYKIKAEKRMKVFLRNIKREVDVEGYHAHVNASSYVDEEHDIDRFHIEDIEEDRKKNERAVINAKTKKLISISEVVKKINENERDVRREMSRRINKKIMFITALVVALVVLAGFVPYVISIFKFSPESFGDGAIIIFLTLFAVLCGGLITLLLLRNRLKKLIKKYNKKMTEFAKQIMSGAKVFSDYYSAVCTCMRERAVLDNSANKQKRKIPFRKRLRANKAKIDDAIDISKGWLYAYGIEDNENLYYEYDVDADFDSINAEINLDKDIISDEYLRVLDPESSEKENYLAINDSEAIVKAPYSFITRLNIVRKNIFEKPIKKDESIKKDEGRQEKCSNC